MRLLCNSGGAQRKGGIEGGPVERRPSAKERARGAGVALRRRNALYMKRLESERAKKGEFMRKHHTCLSSSFFRAGFMRREYS